LTGVNTALVNQSRYSPSTGTVTVQSGYPALKSTYDVELMLWNVPVRVSTSTNGVRARTSFLTESKFALRSVAVSVSPLFHVFSDSAAHDTPCTAANNAIGMPIRSPARVRRGDGNRSSVSFTVRS